MTGLEQVYRDAWAAVVASTARLTRDLDLAEDCAQEAVERALRTWPQGVPDNPAGWLTTTAQPRRARPAAARGDAAAQAAAARGAREAGRPTPTGTAVPDDRSGWSSRAATPRWPAKPRSP